MPARRPVYLEPDEWRLILRSVRDDIARDLRAGLSLRTIPHKVLLREMAAQLGVDPDEV